MNIFKIYIKKIQQVKSEDCNTPNGKREIFDLILKAWKWKWLTAGLIPITCIPLLIFLNTRPVTYTAESCIRVGKIANVIIEQIPEIQLYIKSNIYHVNCKCKSSINSYIKQTVDNTVNILINITMTSYSQETCYLCLVKITNDLLNRHKIIFNKALKKYNEHNKFLKSNCKIIVDPIHFLDTYTFPTALISKPEKPIAPDNKKIPEIMAVAFFASLFLGIFLSFFIDYILTRIKEK